MKLRITLVAEVVVEDLENYEAKTLQEAAENQQRWFDNGDSDVMDAIDTFNSVKVEAVEGW